MAEGIILDPTSEDAANVQLVVTTGSYGLIDHAYPTPPLQAQWAASVSTEGSRLSSWRHENRQITLTIESDGATALNSLEAKVGKMVREGGTYQRTLADATVIVFDVLTVSSYEPRFDQAYHFGGLATVTIVFDCAPYGRGPEDTLTDHTETTLPCLVFTDTGVKGDVPALGRLVIDNDSSSDQWWVAWGIQSRHYSSSANAALFYQAEGRTPLGTAAVAAGPTGASGAGSNVVRDTALVTTYRGILSTQATGAGAHLSHIGTFRVWCRVQIPVTNTGETTVCLEWADGDFTRVTQNTPAELDSSWEGSWRLLDLGLVSLREVAQGAQRWEGRVLAKSTIAGDDIDVDCLKLQPVDEGWGEVSSIFQLTTPTSFSALDEFDGLSNGGALAARTPAIGAAWATSGVATDFSGSTVVESGSAQPRIKRTTIIVEAEARAAVLGSALTNMRASATIFLTGDTAALNAQGVIARYVDDDNYLQFRRRVVSMSVWVLEIVKKVSGTETVIGSAPATGTKSFTAATRLDLVVFAGGGAVGFASGDCAGVVEASDTVLATAGALASGKGGVADQSLAVAGAGTARYYDEVAVSVPAPDAAVFAGQSVEIGPKVVVREDAAGAIWSRPSKYEGNYLCVPPAGAEGRTLRGFVTVCQHVPHLGPDAAIDDISARLYVTPRYLVVPAP